MRADKPKKKVALVLSGGGARGAYEVGVLSYVLDDFARKRGRPPRVQILCGTSVGAINACFLAAHLGDATNGVRRLIDLWTSFRLSECLRFGPKQVLGLPRLVLGGRSATGLFDVAPMVRIIAGEVAWRAIHDSLQHGHLEVLSISATEVVSGRTVIFTQTGPEGSLPTTAPPRTVLRRTVIGPLHALASASIPLLFPPVRIGRELFMDGGVRQNTPIAPALRHGATHVFAIGLSREVRGVESGGEDAPYPGAAMVLGKVLNALLLDHVQTDVDILQRVNRLIEDVERCCGPELFSKVNALVERRGDPPYRPITTLLVRPSDDIGRMAAAYLRSAVSRENGGVARRLLSLLDVGEATESDLASYLLLDGPFARRLINLGRADAEARRHEIEEFFASAEADA